MKFLFLLTFLPLPAYAGIDLHLDPYVCGSMGTWDTHRAQVGVETEMHGESASGGYGAKAALSLNYIFLGYEYGKRELKWIYHKMEAEPADDNWQGEVAGREVVMGPLAGFKTRSNSWMIWYSRFETDELSFNKDQDPVEPAPKYKGKSDNVGIAVKLASFLRIGFEYQRKEYNYLSQNGRSTRLPGLGLGGTQFSPLRRNEFQVFLSIPINFFEKD